MENQGEQRVALVTDNENVRGMTFQQTNVKKTLASVKRRTDAGNAVIFPAQEHGGSFILNLADGTFDEMREENGNYMFDTWIVPPDQCPDFSGQPH